MTLPEWTARAVAEFSIAGFFTVEHQGFPLVKVPKTFDSFKAFLDFEPTFSCDRRIYSEGALILPLGSPE